MPDPTQEQFSDAEIEQRRDFILRRLLAMKPEQHKEIKAKRAKKRSRTQSSTK
jgi:hypothetical protein